MGSLQERVQLRIEWWIQQLSIHLQDHRSRALLVYQNNKELLYHYTHSIWIKVNEFIESNDVLQRFIKRFKTEFLRVSRKIVSPLVRELGRNSFASGVLGFIIGIAMYRILFGGSYSKYKHCPMKPKSIKGITCRESSDLKGYDGLEGIAIKDNIEGPRIMENGEVLVKVIAAAVDPVDVSILSGLGWCERTKDKYSPVTLGRDFSGVVVEVGRDVNHIDIGDSVWGYIPILERSGSMAETIVLPGERTRKKPSNISHEGAATVPFSGMTAWESLGKCGIHPNAAKGKTVLVVDATTAIGCIAIQLVRSWGGAVVSVVGHRQVVPLAKMLGSHQVVVVEHEEPSERACIELTQQTFDAILLTCNEQNGAILSKRFCNRYLNTNNVTKVVEAATPNRIPSDTYGTLRRNFMLPVYRRLFNSPYRYSKKTDLYSKTILDELKQLVDSGKVQPVLDSTCDLTKCEDAFQRTATRSTIGKAVVTFS